MKATNHKGHVMSPRGPCGWALGLLLFTMAVCLLPYCEGNAYQRFWKKHVDYPKSNYGNDNNYCYKMMSQRGLKCQRGNTFIHASEEQLRSICTSNGRVQQGTVTSKTLFSFTSCKQKRRLRRLFCRYKGKSRVRRIRVTCENGLPAHFISYV